MEFLILENGLLATRVFTAISSVTCILGGLSGFGQSYTSTVVGLYAALAATVAFLCEFSPYGLDILLRHVAAFGDYRFRGAFYALAGLLTLGSPFHWLGQLGGSLMIISGALNSAVYFVSSRQPGAVGYDHANAPTRPGGVPRYADPEEQMEGYGEMK
eukprot:GHVT01000694.1.p1 GENE.GHVT01000694.1~~GHVT01000694.1.p1  ORF type:complete len:158 (+),score=32.85 GHVT01000694.1:605-1078(+)